MRELVVVLVMSATAVLTAWCGLQASRWGSAASLDSGRAQAARITASRLASAADAQVSIQVALFTQWLQASAQGDEVTAAYLADRFPAPLDEAFAAWVATDEDEATGATSPFDRPEYVLEKREQAAVQDERADMLTTQLEEANQRSDDYTVLTVGFASVLFFAGMSDRLTRPALRWVLVALAVGAFVAAAVALLLLPKVI